MINQSDFSKIFYIMRNYLSLYVLFILVNANAKVVNNKTVLKSAISNALAGSIIWLTDGYLDRFVVYLRR